MQNHRRSPSTSGRPRANRPAVLWALGCSVLAVMLFGPTGSAGGGGANEVAVVPPEAAPIGDMLPGEGVTTVPGGHAASTGGTWVAQGPGPTLNGQVENIPGGNPVVGGVHTIVAHPTNADIVYLGGVNGGVWKTTNATDASPSWTTMTDQFPSLSIGALDLDPTDATNQTLVAGNGLYSNFGGRGGPQAGLLRTTDGGSSWTQLGQVDLAGRNISGIGARGNTILVAVNAGTSPGMYRSTDGGANFQFISGLNGLNTGAVFDLVGDPGNVNRLYAGVGGASGGVFRTDDAGANWTNVTDAAIGALVGGTTNNIELAVHNNAGAGTNAVYVAIVNGGQLAGILRSANQGGTWTAMDLPGTNEGGTCFGIHPGGQGGNNTSIVADPADANIVYLGGDRQQGPFPNSIGANDFSGRLFRGDASVAPTGACPSPQWTPLTHSGTASDSAPHADSREMVFDANGDIIEGDDGGIYRRTAPTSGAGDWESVIGDLQVTEFHDIAYDTNSDILIGGAQDTGTPQQITTGGTTWDSVDTADGGDVAVDNITLAGVSWSIRYSSNQNLGSFRARVYDAANVFLLEVMPPLTVIGGGAALVPQFVTPVELNALDPTRLIIGGGNSTYESLDQGNTITEAGPGIGVNRPDAVSYGGTLGGVPNPDVLYVGSGNQVFVRTTAGGALNATSGLPGAGTIRDIVLDPDDWMTAFVVDSNSQVFHTPDGGGNWNDITGNLASVAGNLQSIEYVEGTSSDKLVVGTNTGVFTSVEPHFDCWFELGDALPNAIAFDLDYDPVDDLLVAGTLGRGAWTLTDVSLLGVPVITIPGNVVFGDTCVGDLSFGTLNVCNTGMENLVVESITSSDPQFSVTEPSSGFPVVISPDFCFPFQVVFAPTSQGPQSAVLTVASNDPCRSEVEVMASGNGTVPDIRVTGSTDFGQVCAEDLGSAERTVRVCNVGDCSLEVTSAAISACPEADFTLVSNPFPATVRPGACLDLVVRFTPSSCTPEQKMCDLVITSDDPDTPVVTRVLTASTPCASIDVPPDQTFPPTVIQTVGACNSRLPFPVSNTGDCNLVITDLSITINSEEYSFSGLQSFPIILEPGHVVGADIVFAPDVLGRDRTGEVSVTYVSDPIAGTETTVTRSLCGEGVRTGARVLVTNNGTPVDLVKQIKLRRVVGNTNRPRVDTVETARNLSLQTVTQTPPCASFQYHREYGTVSNPIQLLPGNYLVTVSVQLPGQNGFAHQTVAFDVGTCDFNPTVVVAFGSAPEPQPEPLQAEGQAQSAMGGDSRAAE